MKKPSFLKRLTGAIAMDEYDNNQNMGFDNEDGLDRAEEVEE